MRKWLIYKLLLLIVLFLFSTVGAASQRIYINAFYAMGSFEDRHYIQYSDQVALGWAEIRKKDGEIYFTMQRYEYDYERNRNIIQDFGVPKPTVDVSIPSLVKGMRENGNKLKLSVFLNDSVIFRELLDNLEIQQTIIDDMVDALHAIRYFDYNSKPVDGNFLSYEVLDNNKPMGYDGLIIDFEDLRDKYNDKPDVSYSKKYNEFLTRLKNAINDKGELSVCIQPKRQSPIPHYDGYDYAHIGKVADEVILMAHDYQWVDGSIKATAPIALFKEAIVFALEGGIPEENLLVQISLPPVQWRTGRSGSPLRPSYQMMINAFKGNPNEEIIEITPLDQRFNNTLGVGYTYLKRHIYNLDGSYYMVEDEFYYENQRSIELKEQVIKDYNLKGLSVWRLGEGSPDPLGYILRERTFDPNTDSSTTGEITPIDGITTGADTPTDGSTTGDKTPIGAKTPVEAESSKDDEDSSYEIESSVNDGYYGGDTESNHPVDDKTGVDMTDDDMTDDDTAVEVINSDNEDHNNVFSIFVKVILIAVFLAGILFAIRFIYKKRTER